MLFATLNIINEKFVEVFISTFVLILIGYFLRRRQIINDDGKKFITYLLMNFALPFSAFNAFMIDFNKKDISLNLASLLISLFIYLVLLALGLLISFKKEKKEKILITTILMLGQVTFISYPLVCSLFSENEVVTISLITIIFRIFLYVVAYGMIVNLTNHNTSLKTNIRKVLLSPIMIMTFLGLFCYLMQNIVTINDYKILRIDSSLNFLYGAVKLLANLTTPLALLLVGVSIGHLEFKECLKDKLALKFASFRVILAPIVTIIILMMILLINKDLINLNSYIVILLCFSSPTSVVLVSFFNFDKKCSETASSATLLSTIFSLVTLPLMVLVINMIYNII